MDRRLVSPRAHALTQLHLLSDLPSVELHRTARLAAHLARQPGGEPLAAVHLLDDEHQHRLASVGGVPLVRTPVAESMCVQVVQDDVAVYCEDATTAERFTGNPFTTGEDPVRLYYSTPLRTAGGIPIGTLCVFDTRAGALDQAQRDRLDDLAEQTGAHLELSGLSHEVARLATHDPLTDVANRLLLSQELEAAMRDPDRRPHEPALLLVDLDDFKAVNDRYGHAIGDAVLRSTAERLCAAVRDSDLVARLGGDEFAVLLRELPEPELLEALVRRVEQATWSPHETEAGAIACSVSVGRALGRPDELAYELLGRADMDMFARKPGP